LTQGGLLLNPKKRRFENSPNKNEDYVVNSKKIFPEIKNYFWE
jgi:hypothetical protein